MKFSSGMYQRLGLARALIKRPAVLLLDEPTRSLDAAGTAQFWEAIRVLARQNTTVFVATHNFAEAAALATRVLLLHGGGLLADQFVRERRSAEELRALYFRLTGASMEADRDGGDDDLGGVRAEELDEHLVCGARAAS